MRKVLLIMITGIALSAFHSIAQEVSDQCYNCHSVLEDTLKKPADLFKNDIHFAKGVTCAGCHGGNSEEEDMEKAMNPAAGFIGVPKGDDIVKACSKCHGGQSTQFRRSVHGRKPGVISKACIHCHGIHNIAAVKSRRSPFGGIKTAKLCASCHGSKQVVSRFNSNLPTDQFSDYLTSTHGKTASKGDVNAAECSSCHGKHDIKPVKDSTSSVHRSNVAGTCNNCHGNVNLMKPYGLPTGQHDAYQKSVHGIALNIKGLTNAPSCMDCHEGHRNFSQGAQRVMDVCGKCHVTNIEMFNESPHKKAFADSGIADCAGCHGGHNIVYPSDDNLGVGEKSYCIKCHTNDKGYEVAVEMKLLIDSLKNSADHSAGIVNLAMQYGIDIGSSAFESEDIKRIIMNAKTVSHTSDIEKFRSVVGEGFEITTKAKSDSEKMMNDFHRQRYWLGALSTVSVLILAAFIFGLRSYNSSKRKFINQKNKTE